MQLDCALSGHPVWTEFPHLYLPLAYRLTVLTCLAPCVTDMRAASAVFILE